MKLSKEQSALVLKRMYGIPLELAIRSVDAEIKNLRRKAKLGTLDDRQELLYACLHLEAK